MKPPETQKAKTLKGLSRSSRTIKRAELALAVQDRAGLNFKQAREIVDQAISIIADALIDRERVTLIHFGRFEPVERSKRKGRDIVRGEGVSIPARRTIVFQPAPRMLQVIQLDENKAERTKVVPQLSSNL